MKGDNYSNSKHIIEAQMNLNNQKNIIRKKYAELITRELYAKKVGQDNIKIFKWFIYIMMGFLIHGIVSVFCEK